MSEKYTDQKTTSIYREMIVLLIICIIVFILSTLQVKNIISIWNQNDEFGTWQGGAWILGLDWSEVTSANAYYGYGYGFILVFFIKFFGHDSILMTHMAIYFQALMHTSCIFISWYCIQKMFPSVNVVVRMIGSSICILTIPDLFYNYMFFSECILRFLVWVTFALVVSYSYSKRWYKLLLINLIAIYSFSIHQRCILLIAMAVLLFFYESIKLLVENKLNVRSVVWIILIVAIVILFYRFEYKYMQASYISELYSSNGKTEVGGNLLSERGYTIESILKNVIFNMEIEQIAIQNLFGIIYYISAFDCGFALYGFILCISKIKNGITSKKDKIIMPYIYMSCMTLLGIFLVTYQNANLRVYERVELMHYGRYCSYLLAPMIMFGIMWILTESKHRVKKNMGIIIIIFLVSGLSTYTVLKSHNVTNLFAFANACPGIKSVYGTENPFTATLYHTILGVVWVLIPATILITAKKYCYPKRYCIEIGIFIIIATIWITVANRECYEQYEIQSNYTNQTFDLQNILKNENEFATFKPYGTYGSGLLQYNNMFSKIHVLQNLDEFSEDENELLVVSQKGIDEMEYIMKNYNIEYENDRYFVWRFRLN